MRISAFLYRSCSSHILHNPEQLISMFGVFNPCSGLWGKQAKASPDHRQGDLKTRELESRVSALDHRPQETVNEQLRLQTHSYQMPADWMGIDGGHSRLSG